MNILVRVAAMGVRIFGAIVLVLGIIFFFASNLTDNNTVLLIHITSGVIVALSVIVLGSAQAMRGGSPGLAAGAIVLGIAAYFFGLYQANILPDNGHWIIEILHLVIGIALIGLGEMSGAKFKKLQTKSA